MIQKKQQDQQIKNQVMENELKSVNKQKQVQNLQNLARILKSRFEFKKNNTIGFEEFLKLVQSETERGRFLSQKEIKFQIDQLVDVVPEWVNLKETQVGKLIKQITQMNFKQISDCIHSRINQNEDLSTNM